MKNYYEILEVSQKASPEVIEKAYKTLVKKYHPDLQSNLYEKQDAEIKTKEINEAYDVLSNRQKREQYNSEITSSYVDIEQYNLLLNENMNLKKEIYRLNNLNNTNINNNTNTASHRYYRSKNDYENNNNYTTYDYSRNQQTYNNPPLFGDSLKNIIALLITLFILYLTLPFILKLLFL